MNCMKCGREVPDGQVFCPACLEIMAAYPVSPDTPVHIPRRPAKQPEKKAKTLPTEVQILRLKKRIRRLSLTAAVLLVIIGILSVLLLYKPDAPDTEPPTGRNFTTAPR